VLEGTDTNFAELLELSKFVPVIVDLWAQWSEPATSLTPVIENLIREYNGRFVLATATGYQRAEYKALGVDFEERNQLFDEALDVLRGVWSEDEFAYEGLHFTARGQTANPKPARVPIWIGGNSQMARRRVATAGDGWNPFPAPAALAQTAKTPVLETTEDLARMLDDLWRRVDEAGRDPAAIDVAFMTPAGGRVADDDFDADAHLVGLEELSRLGVTWNSVGVPGDSLEHALETLERYGQEVIDADR